MIHINYEDKLIKIQNLINHWKRRILTPIEKIAVIKTLLISILNHLFIALPSPPQNMINKLMFYDFIWQGNVKIN
jgi:hypothetical protein